MNKNIELNFNNELIPAIVQDHKDKEVLMLAYVNKEAWDLSIKTGYTHFYSRSRKKIWKKGESSGHLQEIKEIRVDCDKDTILFLVNQIGDAACHTGHRSCFFRTAKDGELSENSELVFDPKDVYKE